ncbi:MAG TPA: RNA polymerase sigma factor [Chitinophagales bacterium]|nr:RNA polymerase sigma factor [Chitinophagales bacterium]
MMEETDLIAALKKNDESAFKTLVLHFQDRVYSTSLSILQNEGDAEDLSQEVFIEVFHGIKNFKGDAALATWLYRITVNKCFDFLRKKSRKKRFAVITNLFSAEGNDPVRDVPFFNHPGVLMENKERAAILFGAINLLPDQQRIAFTLHKVEGLSHQEISDIMSTTVSSVESLVHRAKQNLRKQLEEFYEKEI